jgi:bidirectional [NiFe] hydrogenase diaphorase subunit
MEEKLKALGEKELARQAEIECRIFCCTSTACLATGSGETLQVLEQGLRVQYYTKENVVEIVQIGCMGLCSRGPLVRVETKDQSDAVYGHIDSELALQILAKHLPSNSHMTELEPKPDDKDIEQLRNKIKAARRKRGLVHRIINPDLPFFSKQTRIVLSETGQLDPESLPDYLAHNGYAALYKVLQTMEPEQVCDEILQSGLRGRGGAGFPTGQKWNFARESKTDSKYVIVNCDEGDPGAYMDRTIMEFNPHSVLEGMMIAGYAIGASSGFLYIRGEYPIAIDRIRKAIRDARRKGIIGKSVMGTDFAFNSEIRIGAGAFVCGEETALIQSIEGMRGMPRMRPPYPSTSGLWGKPTVINNVETLANVPSIIQNGAGWYASIGTEESKGTKVFALTGQLTNTGLIEVPMGITLREIVYEIGGGIPGKAEFKAAQTGGPSGGCIPAEHLDTPVDYENLQTLGSIMGSGGLVIIDDTTSMPEFARFFMDFCVDESCGKCVPCRVGTVQIRALLDKLIAGHGEMEDIDKLERLCYMVKNTSLCGLGQSAPNPVLSTLRFFREEYEDLVPTEIASGGPDG